MNIALSLGSGTLSSNTITNPKEDLKGITTRSGTAYQGPTIPTTSSSLPKVVERETEIETPMLNSELVVLPSLSPLVLPFADALILMPKFGPTIKTLLTNKDKLSELARTPLNEHCLAVLLKKFLEKLGEPDKFLILYRSISRPIGVAEDVYVKMGKFHFSANFVVVDFDADPRVPLILRRSFLKTRRALIDVFKGELTLRVGKEAITFNLDQTLRYSVNYNDMKANRTDVIDMACEEYSQEVLSFSDVIAIDAFLAFEDDPTLLEVDQSYFDPEGDILILEAFFNDDPSLSPPNQGNYLPQDLPPHLEYSFLEGDDKLPVIIAKDLSDEEKTALIKVLKSHKYYCFLDGFSGYFQIPIDLKDQEKTTFTCPYGTFAYRYIPFGLYNALGTFQRCMMAIFHDMIEKTMEVFMDDFSIFRNSFQTCLFHLEKMLKRCEDTNLYLNLEKSHFMVKEGIVLGHKISKNEIEVDKAKVNVIAKLPHPTTVKGIHSFLGHVGFYQRFVQDFSKIA
nr:reverse transcriptase domain-containing protein [Tanacetum cinerariifolium]